MHRGILTLTLSLCIGTLTASGALAQSAAPAITEQEAHAIAVDAYVYFYPLLSMDITRKQFTNVAPGKEMAKGPMNLFSNVPEYPPADFRGVVRSNFDTLYSSAWLDMAIDESCDVGVDTRTGVDDSYKLPFQFTGKIDKLTFKLGPTQLSSDDQKLMRHALERARD